LLLLLLLLTAAAATNCCCCSWLADVDNNEAYERDEYSLAGISEAAPKVKRREEEEDDNRWVGV
jgi:hypothetical protein